MVAFCLFWCCVVSCCVVLCCVALRSHNDYNDPPTANTTTFATTPSNTTPHFPSHQHTINNQSTTNHQSINSDLKPENLLLDPLGYVKIADFGFAKFVGHDKTFTICGTPDYQAPEVIMRRGTGPAADYWALGVLVFEMLVGDPPFKSLTGDPWDTFRRTLSGRFYVPHFIGDAAADLIFKLLQVSPERRLGSGPGGAAEVKAHRWFARVDWAALAARRLPAPIVPALRGPLDTSNFDAFDDAEGDAPPPVPPPRPGEKAPAWELWEWMDSAPWQQPSSAASSQTTQQAGAVAAAPMPPPPQPQPQPQQQQHFAPA